MVNAHHNIYRRTNIKKNARAPLADDAQTAPTSAAVASTSPNVGGSLMASMAAAVAALNPAAHLQATASGAAAAAAAGLSTPNAPGGASATLLGVGGVGVGGGLPLEIAAVAAAAKKRAADNDLFHMVYQLFAKASFIIAFFLFALISTISICYNPPTFAFVLLVAICLTRIYIYIYIYSIVYCLVQLIFETHFSWHDCLYSLSI